MLKQTSKTSPFTLALLAVGLIGSSLLSGCDQKTETPATATAAPAETTLPATTAEAPTPPAATETVAMPEKAAVAEPATKPVQKSKPKTTTQKRAAKPATVHQAATNNVTEKKTQPPICQDCGTITAIDMVEQAGEGSGLGAIVGGVAGAVLGHQVGGGTGKDIATIAGAAGGAYAGHQVEKNVKKTKRYDITVKMENGQQHVVSLPDAGSFMVGDKIKLIDGKLQRN